MRFTTESGSQYELDEDQKHIRRVNVDHGKRGDGDWLRLYNHTEIEVGVRVLMSLESLAHAGPDDFRTRPEDASAITTRLTTVVTEVEA